VEANDTPEFYLNLPELDFFGFGLIPILSLNSRKRMITVAIILIPLT